MSTPPESRPVWGLLRRLSSLVNILVCICASVSNAQDQLSRVIAAEIHFAEARQTVALSLDPCHQSIEDLVDDACRRYPCPGNRTRNDLVQALRGHVQSRGREVYMDDDKVMEMWAWLQELGTIDQGHVEIDPQSWLAHADNITHQQVIQRAEEIRGLLRCELVVWKADCLAPSPLQQGVGACPLQAALNSLTQDSVTVKEYPVGGVPYAVLSVHGDAQLWGHLGARLAADEQLEHARAAYTCALRSLPLDGSPLERLEMEGYLAITLQEQGCVEAASWVLGGVLVDPSLAHDPQAAMAYRYRALTLLPPILHTQTDVAGLRASMLEGLSKLLDAPLVTSHADPLAQLGKTPFHLAHQGHNDLPVQVAMTGVLSRLYPSLLYTAPHVHRTPTALPVSASSPVAVGVVSHHLFDHSIGRMLATLLSQLSTRPHLNLTLFTTATPSPHDQVYVYLKEHVRLVFLPYDLTAARQIIAGSELEVLLYPDVGMEPFTYYLAFARLAPTQAVWWGHPVSTGLPSMDYFISLVDEAPGADQHYSEQVMHMHWVNAPTLRLSPQRPSVGLEEMGLPREAKVYMVVGRLFKVHPDFDDTLLQILRQDPSSVLVLVHEKKRESWSRDTWTRLTSLAPELRGRVRLVHHWNYVNALHHASAVLDTWPYGGCLSTLDAWAHAVPVVTLPSHLLRGRFTLALYRQMGLLDLVAHDKAHFVSLALRLGNDPTFRQDMVTQIIHRHDRLGGPREQVAAEWEAMLLRIANREQVPTYVEDPYAGGY